MNIHKQNIIYTIILNLVFTTFTVTAQDIINKDMESDFKTPPSSIHTSVYWYWIDGNITKEGVLKDLDAMKKTGINRAFIGNLGGHGMGDPKGNHIKLFSNEWWDITHAALKKAGELDIEIGFFNSPGWSQAGGPWIKSNEAMRFLASTETVVKGPGTTTIQLEEANNASKIETLYMSPGKGMVSKISDKRIGKFEDVKVIAYPKPKNKLITLNNRNANITSQPLITGIENLFNTDKNQGIIFPKTESFHINIQAKDEFIARSLTIYPNETPIYTPVELQVKKKGAYETVASFSINRTNPRITAGYEPWAPIVISLDAVKGKAFRIIFKNPQPNAGIMKIELSSSPKLERYKEKILAKMYDGNNPGWNDYMWREQPDIDEKAWAVNPKEVVDLSDKMSHDGTLTWDVPEGEWIILRTGMLLTGSENAPAMPDATGWEVDKLSKKHIETHFNAFIGKILEKIPPHDRKTFRVVVQDSYEMGGQNFTDGFLDSFKEKYGYDPMPYLPSYFGVVVGSPDQSDRFLWDIRRLIADKTAYDYVGGLRAICNKHGLTTWLENYGHFGFPGEFLQYGGQSDEVAGEFWAGGSLSHIENRLASSCAHIYGKKLVSSESFTGGAPAYSFTPAKLKQSADCSFTKGINNTLFHVFIQQPDDRAPGFNAWFGTEFDRNNVWFEQMDLFTDYIKRCNYMLRQGNFIADVAYFIGEDTPKMDGIQDPKLPKGYQFDYINAEVLIKDAYVKDGRLTLPHGISYRILVLPKLKTMRPALIDKLEKLIADGAIVVGPAPDRSPSLENQPYSDQHVKNLSSKIWNKVDGINVKSSRYGKGFIYNGVELNEVMSDIDCVEDCKIDQNLPISYAHLHEKGNDIYFIANQGNEQITTEIVFRVKDMQPELWNPVTGKNRLLPAFQQKEKTTIVPVMMDRGESFFIVFRKPGKPVASSVEANFPVPTLLYSVTAPWKIHFESKIKQPEPIKSNQLINLSDSPDEKIKYFSGKATYSTTIQGINSTKGETILLNLGNVNAMAKVKVNGQYAGGTWTYPYKVDVTKQIRKGKNQIEIEVVNTWVNRIIGDMNLPENKRNINILFNPYQANSHLPESGLIGPVTLEKVSYY